MEGGEGGVEGDMAKQEARRKDRGRGKGWRELRGGREL